MPPLSLDHVGVIVRDLAAGAARWERLGFRLTPLSPQMGLGADGGFEPWATANHCAVLERGYLELIGVHRPERRNPWAAFLDRFEGGHITALRCERADDAYAAVSSRCDDFDPPVARRRDAPFLDDGAWTTREMQFRNVFSRDARVPEGRYILIEHQTPEVLWQAPLMCHANGASSIESVCYCAADPAPLAERLARIADAGATAIEGGLRIDLPGGGRVEVLRPAAFAARFPGAAHPPVPAIAAVTVGVARLAATREVLAGAGVAVHGDDGGAWVAPTDGNGVVIEFTERSGR